jgi:hypothetical protein
LRKNGEGMSGQYGSRNQQDAGQMSTVYAIVRHGSPARKGIPACKVSAS